MTVLAMTVPIPLGKVETQEAHIAEAIEHEDLNKTLNGFGIEHESRHIQETPEGTLLILVFQCEDPPAMLEAFGKSDAPLPVMQKQFLKETLGIDLSQPPPGPPPRMIFEWS
jgi:hypothetical protein|tara:strand:- start:1835 stop:2170 length:336 start_codon:yes stop_codon:yes gene_type:complete